MSVKCVLVVALLFGLSNLALSQCTGGFMDPFSSVTVNNSGDLITISTCNFTGDYSVINGVSNGEDYQFTANLGTYITIREGSNAGPVIANGTSPVSITATSNNDLYVSWHANSGCGTDINCRVTAVQCTSCSGGGGGTPPPAPGGVEYINWYPWTNGGLAATNWQSDPDKTQDGTKTGCVFADIQITNDGPFSSANEPSWTGIGELYSLQFKVDWTNTSQVAEITIDLKDGFNGAITDYPVSFNIYDINAASCGGVSFSNRFIDIVSVTGYKSNLTTPVAPVYSNVCAGQVVSGNEIRGTDDCGSNALGATVSFPASDPVARIVIEYKSGTGSPGAKSCGGTWPLNPGENPLEQYIHISPLTIDFDCNVPLPVDFVNATAVCDDFGTRIHWTTASEINNDFFTVERSVDGINYEEIGHVTGAGTASSFIEYSFLDTKPLRGTCYYKLSQTDFDGTRKHMTLLSHNNNCVSELSLSLYPNPALDILSIDYYLQKSTQVDLKLMDELGRVVLEIENSYKSKGFQSKKVDVSALSNGVYILSGFIGEQKVSQKVVVKS